MERKGESVHSLAFSFFFFFQIVNVLNKSLFVLCTLYCTKALCIHTLIPYSWFDIEGGLYYSLCMLLQLEQLAIYVRKDWCLLASVRYYYP